MLSHQKGFEGFDSQASSLLTSNVQAELDRWQKIVFFSDMDDGRTPSFPSQSNRSNEQSSSSGSRSTQDQNNPVNTTTSTDVSDALLLAQFAATSGLSQHPHRHDEFYATMLSLLQSQSHDTPSSSSFPFGGSPFNNPSHPQTQPSFQPANWTQNQNQNAQSMFPSSAFPYPQPSMMPLPQSSASTARNVAAPPTSPSIPAPATTDPNDPAAMDEAVVAEDKRRRNTLASARFRIKKKQRNLNLERTVSDLTGRAEELEREAADLRRENGWLKEIVMLKGSRLAGLDVSPHTLRAQGETSGAGSSNITAASDSAASSSRQEEKSASEDSDSGSDYQPEDSRKREMKKKDKGKGKK